MDILKMDFHVDNKHFLQHYGKIGNCVVQIFSIVECRTP